MNICRLTTAGMLLAMSAILHAQHCEGPYFQVTSETTAGSFPLLSTTADVRITGPIADVRVIQKYRNDGNSPIEAVYVFPASTRAAVYHMEMHIGTRVVRAEIMERQEAVQTYESAKQEGKRASLLEQYRPNVFQMQVANIMPGEAIDVYLYYTEMLIPESQEYTFVYPTVVGPRYHSPTAQAVSASFPSLPYLHEGLPPTYTFDISVELNMPVPLARVRSSSHEIDLSRTDRRHSTITLAAEELHGGNRDFILSYSLSGNQIASGALTYEKEGECYFLCQVEPPHLKTSPVIVPREYIFIVDVSGSMHGFPLDISKELMRNLLSQLRPTDQFNVLFFAGSSFVLSPSSQPVTPANMSAAFTQMERMEGYGGTELLPALQRAMQVPKMQGYARSFVIITDGYVMVEEAAFRMVRENLDRANFFAFGIGSSVNRHLIEGLAHVGRGEPFIVTEDKEAKKTAAQFKSYIEHPILTDIRVTSNGVTLSELIPEHIPDLLAARPVYFTGKFSGNEVASLTVSGRQGSTPFTTTITLPVPRLENAALPYLWAREKIRLLDDFNAVSHSAERVREITNLGLKYNLLTKYTAFVAVDHEIVNETGEQKRVNQPLPLPESVSDYAIGFEMEFEEVGGGEPVLFTVDVQCDDRDIKLFVESVLELAMDTLTHADMLAFAGQTVEVFIDGPGGHIQVGGSGTLNVFVRTAIQGAFAKLGFPVRGRHKVMISVTSTGH